MRRVIVGLMFVVLLAACTLQAAAPAKPVEGEVDMAGYWELIVPEETVNRVLNPSAEAAGNYAAAGGAVVNRGTAYANYGAYSYQVITAANNDGIQLTLSTLANAVHYVTVRMRGAPVWDWSLDNANWTTPTLIETFGDWKLYGASFPAAQANGSTTLYIYQNGAGGFEFYLDGVQVEQKSYWTTYVDGDQPGCEWGGPLHGSYSTRSAQSRAGGRVRNLADDYSLYVNRMLGVGHSPLDVGADEYATLPGGQVYNVRQNMREFILTGSIVGDDLEDLHDKRRELLDDLRYDAVAGLQPVRLRYTGAGVTKQIAAHFIGGLEGDFAAELTAIEAAERVSLRFLADDPYFYSVGESAQALDLQNTTNFSGFAFRNKDTGQWENLGVTLGLYGAAQPEVRAILVASDGTLYIGGFFGDVNGIANTGSIAKYSFTTNTWSAVDTGFPSGGVYAFAEGPDGTIYIGGTFVNAGGDADADKLCKYDGATLSALNATPLGDAVKTLAFAPNGILYLGGTFVNAGGVADADHVAQYNPATGAYSAISTTVLGNDVNDLIAHTDGYLYITGEFTIAPTSDGAGKWSWVDGGTITLISQSDMTGGIVQSSTMTPDGTLYLAGYFTNAGSAYGDYACYWRGGTWLPMGTGLEDVAHKNGAGPDGLVYYMGEFTEAGGLSVPGYALWNGSTWAHWDLDITVTAFYAFAVGRVDPVIDSVYDVYLGWRNGAAVGGITTGTHSGVVTVTNSGTTMAYPTIKIRRTGGTTAKLKSIRNETTGKTLFFDYDIQDGETLYIYLEQQNKRVISAWFGPRSDVVLHGSDFGSFGLKSGDNRITTYVQTTGGPTLEGSIIWRDAYISAD